MSIRCHELSLLKELGRAVNYALFLASFLPDSRTVVRTLIGDFAFTLRASVSTKLLRRVPVRRGLVRFFGLPIGYDAPDYFL
jgi:hypothetical protein